MYPKKKRGNVQKPSPASRTVNQNRNSERQTKKNITTENVQATSRNIKQARSANQKNKLEQKKKKTEISAKSNLKQPRLLHKKNNLKNISSTKKTGSKIVRKSKKSTLEPLTDESKKNGGRIGTEISTSIPSFTATRMETNENTFVPESTQTSVNPFMPSSSVARKEDTCVSRGSLQLNKSPLELSHTANAGVSRETLQLNRPRMERSHITDTDFSRRALQSTKSFLVPGVRVITPSTAVSPASVIRDEPSVIRNLKPTGFNRNLEPSEILDMAEVHDNLYFLMKWKGSPAIDLIPVKIANERCPQLVIQFYESRLKNVFKSSN